MSESSIEIQFQDVPRFAPGDPQAEAFLEDQGYVVFGQALSGDQADVALALL